jgi:hypothetical protein
MVFHLPCPPSVAKKATLVTFLFWRNGTFLLCYYTNDGAKCFLLSDVAPQHLAQAIDQKRAAKSQHGTK